VDTSNRYVAALQVNGGLGMCGGVLVEPDVVLTAGHCVCAQRPADVRDSQARTLIDKTTCAGTATVKAVTYRPGAKPEEQTTIGTVRPHDQLRILYNDEDKEVSSSADLAVIILKEPLQGIKPMRLMTGQVRYAQPVLVVGFGRDQLQGGIQGVRRFGFNEIASVSEDGATFLVGKPIRVKRPYKPKDLFLEREEASYSLEGDSGGPCLIERNGVMELVGIAKTHYGNRELVQFSEYTSTVFYLGWLRQEIAKAKRRGAD
jgi:hypothetical protein